jgi:hypothetical protein
MNSPPAAMNGSGVQYPPGHAARRDASLAGTSALGTQCAPPLEQHAGNVLGSTTGGPTCGHAGGDASGTGAASCVAASARDASAGVALSALPASSDMHASIASHAPVGIELNGLMHGAHRSSEAQMSCGNALSTAATSRMQTLSHAPSAPPIDVQCLGVYDPPERMNESGTHSPPGHVSRCETCDALTSDAGRQCACPKLQHAGSVDGSIARAAQLESALARIDASVVGATAASCVDVAGSGVALGASGDDSELPSRARAPSETGSGSPASAQPERKIAMIALTIAPATYPAKP